MTRCGRGGAVVALAASRHTVYAAGNFGGIAALDASDGRATWTTRANGSADALALSGPTLYAGGRFSEIGGSPRRGVAALRVEDGQPTAWDPHAESLSFDPPWVATLTVSGPTRLRGRLLRVDRRRAAPRDCGR